jgi:hypothetical protein
MKTRVSKAASPEKYRPPGSKRFAAGNPGRPKGAKNKKPAIVRDETPAEIGKRVIVDDFETILKKAKEKALDSGSVGDLIALAKLEHPGPQRRVSLPELATMRPEDRVVAINAHMFTGRIGLDDGRALIAAAEREFSATVQAPLRSALMALKAGASLDEVGRKLAAVAHRLALIDETRGRSIIEGEKAGG